MTKGAPAKVVNPFYVLLVIAGILFTITACAYGVMTIKQLDPHAVGAANFDADRGHPLMQFVDQHGLTVMAVQLIVLAVATFAAMATDNFWTRLAERRNSR